MVLCRVPSQARRLEVVNRKWGIGSTVPSGELVKSRHELWVGVWKNYTVWWIDKDYSQLCVYWGIRGISHALAMGRSTLLRRLWLKIRLSLSAKDLLRRLHSVFFPLPKKCLHRPYAPLRTTADHMVALWMLLLQLFFHHRLKIDWVVAWPSSFVLKPERRGFLLKTVRVLVIRRVIHHGLFCSLCLAISS